MAYQGNLPFEVRIALSEQSIDAVALGEDRLDDMFAVRRGLVEEDVECEVGHEGTDSGDALDGYVCERGVFVFVAGRAGGDVGFGRVSAERLLGEVQEVAPACVEC